MVIVRDSVRVRVSMMVRVSVCVIERVRTRGRLG